jgi:hypothetical protein
MSILDWFRSGSDTFDPDRISDETVRLAVGKAIALTNPRLKLVYNYEKRLSPSAATTIGFMKQLVKYFPPARPLSPGSWSSDPAMKAFFVAPADLQTLLSRADDLRALFSASPNLQAAYLILGMAYRQERVFGMALQGDIVVRDVAQRMVNFSDHKTRFCAEDEMRLRRVVGVEVFEHLVSRALSDIGAERNERAELQTARSLIRARLRLLSMHGPGLGSMLGEAPAKACEQAALEVELLENERQLEALETTESSLESEFETLKTVLDNPQDYLSIEPVHLCLSPLNLVLDDGNSETAAGIDFAVITLKRAKPLSRAFIVARVERSDMPPPQKMDLQEASRYL